MTNISTQTWQDNLERWRTGHPVTLEELYVLPTSAKVIDSDIHQKMRQRKWGVVVVVGENGAGKSAYFQHIGNISNTEGYAYCSVIVSPQEIKQYRGPLQFFNKQFSLSLTLPIPVDDQKQSKVLWKLENEESFRAKVGIIIKNNFASFAFHNRALATALLHATSDDQTKRNLAISWLNAQPLVAKDLRTIEIYDPTMKSILNIETHKLIIFLRDLVQKLGYSGLVVLVDEIEKVAFELSISKAVESLSAIRDLSEEMDRVTTQASQGVLDGLFLILSFTLHFLSYEPTVAPDIKARADKFLKPKITIAQVPRLDRVIRQTANQVDTQPTKLEDLYPIAEKVILCYSKSNDKNIDILPKNLAEEANGRVEGYKLVTGANIAKMIEVLTERYG